MLGNGCVLDGAFTSDVPLRGMFVFSTRIAPSASTKGISFATIAAPNTGIGARGRRGYSM